MNLYCLFFINFNSSERIGEHKRKSKTYTSKICKLIRLYGNEHFKIILIKNISCNNVEELKKEERKEIELIEKRKRLNEHIPTKTRQEYYLENKEHKNKYTLKKKEAKKLYYEKNKENFLNKPKIYIIFITN